MSETNDGQPSGWVKTTLSQVTSASRAKAEPDNFGNVPYIGLEYIEGGSNRILSIGRLADVRSTKSIFQRGDVLYGKLRPYLKKVCRPDFDGVCSTDILVFPESPNTDNGYLLYFLSQQSTADYATQNSNGINLPRISSRALGEIKFPLPPLAEQRRIVAKIEAVQERSRRAREALSEVAPLLEQFRQSVLAAAFRGDLTIDWRAAHPNVEPASEFLQRIRAERRRRWKQAEFAKYEAKGQKPPQNWQDKYKEPELIDDAGLPELPEGWAWATIDEISPHIVDCPHSTPQWTEEGKLCVRTTEFRPGKLDLTNARFVSPETFNERIQRLKPQPGDILYSREGGILGISCQVPADTELCLGQRMMLMRTDVHFLSRLLMHWLNSPRTLDRVKRLTSGSASPHLNVGEVKRFPVPVAPLEEQSKLLEQIESCLATPEVCGQMATDYEQQLDQFDQSILAKAFRGELVPQAPSDEPALVLLEHVRAQRKQEAKALKQTSNAPRKSKMARKLSKLTPQQLTLAEVLRSAD